jgi:hypothetical protein
VFPGIKPGRPIGSDAMMQVLKGLRPGVTVHGCRSAFRDWVSEHGISGDIAEACLAHRSETGSRRPIGAAICWSRGVRSWYVGRTI